MQCNAMGAVQVKVYNNLFWESFRNLNVYYRICSCLSLRAIIVLINCSRYDHHRFLGPNLYFWGIQRRLMPRRLHWQQLRSQVPTWWPSLQGKTSAPRTLTVMTWRPLPAPWPCWLQPADFKPWCQAILLPPLSPLLSKLSPWRLCPAGLSRRRKGWCKSVTIYDSDGAIHGRVGGER